MIELSDPELIKINSELFSKLLSESGRGAILIATTYVEDHLKLLIESNLPDDLSPKDKKRLFSYPGQLSSFASKIELSFAFKLIDKNLRDSLNELREIRNEAAHSSDKFEISNVNYKMRKVFNVGDDIPWFVNKISTESLVKHKLEQLSKIFEEYNLSDEKKEGQLQKFIQNKEVHKSLEEQLPLWELVFGITLLCATFILERRKIEEAKRNK